MVGPDGTVDVRSWLHGFEGSDVLAVALAGHQSVGTSSDELSPNPPAILPA